MIDAAHDFGCMGYNGRGKLKFVSFMCEGVGKGGLVSEKFLENTDFI